MGTRYIEINSAYRNRDEYPEVSEFVIPFSVDTQNTTSVSYVSTAFPIYVFKTGSLNVDSSIFPNNYFITDNLSTPSVYTPVSEDGAYVGYNIAIPSAGPPVPIRPITGFAGDTSTFTLTPPFDYLAGGINPITPFTTTYDLIDPSPFYDSSLDVYRVVAQNKDLYGRIPTPGSNILPEYNLIIESTYPTLPILASFICWADSKIKSYEIISNQILTYKNPYYDKFPGCFGYTNPVYSIRKSLPLQKGYLLYAPTRNTVQITPIPGMKPDAYKGLLVYIIPFKSADPTQITGDENIYPDVSINRMTWNEYVYPIKSFDPLTNIATLTKKINSELFSAPWGVSVNPNGIRPYEILGNVSPSVHPLTYSGSLVSQSEVVCYEVELLDLILPNVTLSGGSRIIKYPYVYVVLKTDGTDFKVGRNIITSNNPNSYEATFVCGVTNIVDPQQARFVKIDAAGMTQTIKFKPNSTLYFKVYLPDGTPFKPAEDDYPSPLPANPLLQIEAIFGIRRV